MAASRAVTQDVYFRQMTMMRAIEHFRLMIAIVQPGVTPIERERILDTFLDADVLMSCYSNFFQDELASRIRNRHLDQEPPPGRVAMFPPPPTTPNIQV